jgi:hypothetical protein
VIASSVVGNTWPSREEYMTALAAVAKVRSEEIMREDPEDLDPTAHRVVASRQLKP